MDNIVVLHFGPLELYPPVQNLLSFFKENLINKHTSVISTGTNVSVLKKFQSPSSKIKIIRLGRSGQKFGLIERFWCYFIFNVGSLFYLLVKRPTHILYYETLSSFPVYVYKRFFGKNTKILILYHEYTLPEEYEKGMKLTKWFHRTERWLYPKASWLSHTNNLRMQLFLKDIEPIKLLDKQILPNYPSKKWMTSVKNKNSYPLKVVYVGAVSMETMYTKEFAEWILLQEGNIIWDIYSYNITDEAKKYLSAYPAWINLKSGLNYNDLPTILKKYHIGVILYKGHISNYVYNAPNKLFEYLACGLDVWFPEVLTGCLPYVTDKIFPKVTAFNFERLNDANLENLMERSEYIYKEPNYYWENVFGKLTEKINANLIEVEDEIS